MAPTTDITTVPSVPDINPKEHLDCEWGTDASAHIYEEISAEYDFHKYCNRYTTYTKLGDIRGLKILDMPSGPGTYAREFLLRGAGQVTSVDIMPRYIDLSLEAVTKLQEEGVSDALSRWDGVAADGCIPRKYPGGPFDLVIPNFMIENFSTREAMLACMRNFCDNLRPGGKYVGIWAVGAHSPERGQIVLDTVGMNTSDSTNLKLLDTCYITYAKCKTASNQFKWYYLTEEAITEIMEEAGFINVRFERLMVDPEYTGPQDLHKFVNNVGNRQIICEKPE